MYSHELLLAARVRKELNRTFSNNNPLTPVGGKRSAKLVEIGSAF